jgi:hypothetical protein
VLAALYTSRLFPRGTAQDRSCFSLVHGPTLKGSSGSGDLVFAALVGKVAPGAFLPFQERLGTAGFDVNRTLRIAAVDVAVGRIPAVQHRLSGRQQCADSDHSPAAWGSVKATSSRRSVP